MVSKACKQSATHSAQLEQWRKAWEAEAREWLHFVQQLAQPMICTPGGIAELAQQMSTLSMQPAQGEGSRAAAGTSTAVDSSPKLLDKEP